MSTTDESLALDDARRAYAQIVLPREAQATTTTETTHKPSVTYVFETNDVRLAYFLDLLGKRRARNIRAGNAHGHTTGHTVGGRRLEVFDTALPFLGPTGAAIEAFQPVVDTDYSMQCPRGTFTPIVPGLRADGQDQITYVTPPEEIVRAPTASGPVILPLDTARSVIFVPVWMVRVDTPPDASAVLAADPCEDSSESHDDHACCLEFGISPCDCVACNSDHDD